MVINWDPFMGDSNLMQLYGSFEGFPKKNSALLGLVT